MKLVILYLVVAGAGTGGFALLRRLGFGDFEAWAGGRVVAGVLITLPAWWLGAAGAGAWKGVAVGLLALATLVGVVELWRHRPRWRELLVAEGIFLAAFLLVLLIRIDHPQILETEKPMDMGILATLLRARSFPPPDMWLAGWSLPYYYWGALAWIAPLVAAGVVLEVGYNLVVALVAAEVAALAAALGRRLGRGYGDGLLAAFLAILAGTPDGLRQLLAGVAPSHVDLWASSRQVTDTITEYPLFTVWLGDLHPHYLAMPLALLAILVALEAGSRSPRGRDVALLAVLVGVVWAANPWAMPPTGAAVALLLLYGDGRWRLPGPRAGWRSFGGLVALAGGWLVTVPFQLGFSPPFRGFALVARGTEPSELLLYAGCLLVPVAGVAVHGLARELAPRRLGADAKVVAGAALVVLFAAASGRPTMVIGIALLGAVTALAVAAGDDLMRPALLLATLAVLLVVVPEILYVRDPYGEQLARMNTVFKSYIQAWLLLAVVAPALLRRWLAGRPRARVVVLVAVLVVPSLPHLVAAGLGPVEHGVKGLDGLRWMDQGDRAIVRFLRGQPPGTTLIEAVGDAYSEYARLASASGVPAYLGWANHESVWRGGGILAETGRRRELVERIYHCADPEVVRSLVTTAGVELVAIGSLERRDAPAEGLAAVAEAGDVVLAEAGALLVRFAGDERQVERPR